MIPEELRARIGGVPRLVERVSFWGAIVLPFLYLPMLVMGLNTVEEGLLFLGLITLNVVMVILGQSYERQ
jgi:hypothetical protein